MFFGREKVSGGAIKTVRAVRTILIVEDEPLVAFDNEHLLEQAGYAVIGTVDGFDQAVAAIDQGGIDLVIADVRLRGARSGIDVARYASDRSTPVLFATGACPVDAQQLGLACLAKPHSQRDLLAAIEVVDAALRNVPLPRTPAGLQVFTR